MNIGKEAYMKMGIVHFMAYPELGGGSGPWADTVNRIARDPFFSAIEITHIADSDQRRQVRDICRLSNLSVGFGAHPTILSQGLNLNALEETDRSRAVGILKGLIDEAIFMNAESCVFLSGKDPG
jgi:hypothetical protein